MNGLTICTLTRIPDLISVAVLRAQWLSGNLPVRNTVGPSSIPQKTECLWAGTKYPDFRCKHPCGWYKSFWAVPFYGGGYLIPLKSFGNNCTVSAVKRIRFQSLFPGHFPHFQIRTLPPDISTSPKILPPYRWVAEEKFRTVPNVLHYV